MQRARIIAGPLSSEPSSRPHGAFAISGPLAMQLRIVASDGLDWTDAGLPLPAWEHVSVSLARRCPTWAEMEWVREQFWSDDELVIQLSVPRAKHINLHQYTLHLWRPVGVTIPLPPASTVAPVGDA